MSTPTPRKLSHYFTASRRKGRDGLPLMSVTMHNGLVRRDELDRKMDSALTPEEHLLVEPNDIAYNTMRMWQGCFGLAEEAANVSPAYVVMRPKDTVDPRFAAHWFKSDRGLYMLWAYSYGLTEDRLRLYGDEFLLIPVTWPDRNAQVRIADVIEAWDEAVNLQSRAIKAMKMRQKALARHLFGDVHNPFQVNGHPLTEYASITYGKAVDSAHYDPSGSGWILASQGVVGMCSTHDFVGEAIIVGRKGTLDNPIYIPEGQGFCAIDTTFVLSPKEYGRCLFHYLRHVDLKRLNQASGVPSISADTLRALSIPELSEEAGNVLDALDAQIDGALAMLSNIRRQKQGLMQKLLTGEWPVPDSIDRLMPGGDAAAALACEASAA